MRDTHHDPVRGIETRVCFADHHDGSRQPRVTLDPVSLQIWENEGGQLMSRRLVQVRRIYDDPAPDDGTRVLVDRIWPRGVSKVRAHLNEWCNQIAPSTDLRLWYRHDPKLFSAFARRYRAELTDPGRAAALVHLFQLAKLQKLTLLTATRDVDLSEAAVLAEVINVHL